MKTETMARTTCDSIRDRLLDFCTRHGSPNSAAGVLKTDGLSFAWIKGFAGGQLTNPTIDKLSLLEIRLEKAETSVE